MYLFSSSFSDLYSAECHRYHEWVGKVSDKLDSWMTAGIKVPGSHEHHQFASAPSQQSRWEERLTLYNQTQDADLGLLAPAAGRHPARQPRGQARRVLGRVLHFGQQLYIDI